MGMFDNITVSPDYKLPIDEEQQRHIEDHVGANNRWKRRFQTKDLECLLDYYEIDASGTLWFVADDGSKSKADDVTTTMSFYDYITNNSLNTDLNITFEALVIQGEITHVKMTDFSSHDNSSRVAAHAQWMQSCEQAQIRQKRLCWKLYNWLYATHVNWCLRMIYKAAQYVSNRALNQWRRRLLFWD